MANPAPWLVYVLQTGYGIDGVYEALGDAMSAGEDYFRREGPHHSNHKPLRWERSEWDHSADPKLWLSYRDYRTEDGYEQWQETEITVEPHSVVLASLRALR